MSPVRTEVPALKTGYTLVELLVALALLAIMSALTYRAVSGTLEAEKQVKEMMTRWQDVAIFFDQLERDTLQAIPRTIRDEYGNLQPEWILRPNQMAGEESPIIEWTRLGNSGMAAAPPLRVGLRLNAGRLEYLQWSVLDRAPSTKATPIIVAESIKELHWRCLARDDRWLETWPMPGMVEKLPRAVEITLVLDDGSTIRRIFTVGAT